MNMLNSPTRAMVAVITRTKNRTVLLRRAIESVLAQGWQDWVHVIVNDGGKPEDVEALVAQFESRYRGRVMVRHNPQSLGMEAASNVGIRASSSKYVVIHDDDDSWEPSFLEKCVAYLESPPPVLNTPIKAVVTHSVRVLEQFDGNTVTPVGREPFNRWMNGVSLYRLAASNPIPPISFVFDRAAGEELGFFREALPVLGDWDFHLRFAARHEIGLIREELANYHHRTTLASGDYGNSVFTGDDKHRRYEHLLRNELLRQDLAEGRFGLGLLVNMANSFENVHQQFSLFESMRDRLRRISLLRWFYHRLKRS